MKMRAGTKCVIMVIDHLSWLLLSQPDFAVLSFLACDMLGTEHSTFFSLLLFETGSSVVKAGLIASDSI